MDKSFKLRSAIEKEMIQQGYNFASLGEKSGMNRGVFSAILNSTPPKPVSFHQLTLITEALDMPTGWLFDEYVGECFYEGKPNRRRIEPFLLACAELGRYDLVRSVLKRLLRDLKYLGFVFETAEMLFLNGQLAASAPFYECVIEHEKHQHSLRLSVCQYRLFRARLGEDREENLKAAVQFEPFRFLLPDALKLDALLQLSNLYYELGKYIEMERVADELYLHATNVYERLRRGESLPEDDPKPFPRRPLVLYYGSGLLHKQLALIEQKRYEEARPYSERYGNLDHFELLDEGDHEEVQNFKIFAQGNRLDIELMLGNFSVLPEYEDYMDHYPNELLPCLTNLVEAANLHGVDIDDLIAKRYLPLEEYLASRPDNYYPESIIRSTFASLHYHLAVYHYHRQRQNECAIHVRECWQLSQDMNNQQHFRQLASLLSLVSVFARETESGDKPEA
ncbi:hypothetical protein B9G55_09560 [Saccharibacillus sp. O16]|nr:hypothetical protein B9G55_09560 [Saccharibacillus sp. O16]